MKITLENQSDISPLKVIVDSDNWEDTAMDALELFIGAMASLGYHYNSVQEAIKEKAYEYEEADSKDEKAEE
jgi:hypothetical protein